MVVELAPGDHVQQDLATGLGGNTPWLCAWRFPALLTRRRAQLKVPQDGAYRHGQLVLRKGCADAATVSTAEWRVLKR